jgi:hypothetical protein
LWQISLLVSAVAVVCAFTSVMFLLLHILVLIQKVGSFSGYDE